MRNILGVILAAIALPSAVVAQESMREVNITAGSQAGWIPSEETEQQAVETWKRFFGKLDSGDYETAFMMQADGTQEILPLSEFTEIQSQQRQTRGALRERRLTKITWTKDSSSQPKPGTYVAIDFQGTFELVSRYCGYSVLYRGPDEEQFQVVRTQEVLISDKSYEAIVKNGGAGAAEAAWAEAQQFCPNYIAPN